jgi:hypothetical protein
MFLAQYDQAYLLKNLLSREQWRPFPQIEERQAWNELLEAPLNQQRKRELLEQARAILGSAWPPLPATLYMEFQRNGDRHRYEKPYFQRRQRLAVLVLAECLSAQGEFLDEIANGLWCLLEEPTWCIPAHSEKLPGDPLPSHERESVDLFACETAMALAETLYLLQGPLEGLSHSLCERVRQSVLNRVIAPAEERTEFFWLTGQNNWTPWCMSNVLGAAMYLVDSPDRLAALAAKFMPPLERFIGNYGDDGGCDEGPGYWGVAAGAMLQLLELLHSRSQGKVDIYAEPRIRRMGQFIADVHLGGPWFVNFADAPAKVQPRRAVVYRYGQRIGDQRLQDLALLSARSWDPAGTVFPLFNQGLCGGDLMNMLRELFWVPAMAQPDEWRPAQCVWLPDLQVMVARENRTEGQGLVLAAKGGHNAENHNHNDVGQFIVFVDGQPGVIDIGVETYSRKTFSEGRYELWCIRSSGHNVPQINGFEQAEGAVARARNVEFAATGIRQSLSLDLEEAYPRAAGVRRLHRELVFEGGGSPFILARDSFEMAEGIDSLVLPLFCQANAELVGPGRVLIATQPRALVLEYDAEQFRAEVSVIPLEDQRLRASWGSSLHKIELHYLGRSASDTYELLFSASV